MTDDVPESGWSYVARRESAAKLIGTLIELDEDVEYAKTEIAEAAGIPLKTLYLTDILEEWADMGVLVRAGEADDTGETCYRVKTDCDLLTAAAEFDDAFRNHQG